MQANVMKLKETMNSSGFMKYPVIELEDSFVPTTDDHGKRAKETGKFLGRLNKLTPAFDEIWDKQLNVLSKLYNVEFIYKNLLTVKNFEFLAVNVYSPFEAALSDLNKTIKAYRKQFPEIDAYYKEYDHILEVNTFEMFMKDVEAGVPIAQENYSKYKSNPDARFDIDLDQIKVLYSKALKSEKKKFK